MTVPTALTTQFNPLLGQTRVTFTHGGTTADVLACASSGFAANVKTVASSVPSTDSFLIDHYIGTGTLEWPSAGVQSDIFYRVRDHGTPTDLLDTKKTTLTGTGSWLSVYRAKTAALKFTVAAGMTELKFFETAIKKNAVQSLSPEIGCGLKATVYAWDTNYATSITGTEIAVCVLAERWFTTTSAAVRFVFTDDGYYPGVTVTPGDFLIVFSMEDTTLGSFNDNYQIEYGAGSGAVYASGSETASRDLNCSYGNVDYVYVPARSADIIELWHPLNLSKRLTITPTSDIVDISESFRQLEPIMKANQRTQGGTDLAVRETAKPEIRIPMKYLPETIGENLDFWLREFRVGLSYWPKNEYQSNYRSRFIGRIISPAPEYATYGRKQFEGLDEVELIIRGE